MLVPVGVTGVLLLPLQPDRTAINKQQTIDKPTTIGRDVTDEVAQRGQGMDTLSDPDDKQPGWIDDSICGHV